LNSAWIPLPLAPAPTPHRQDPVSTRHRDEKIIHPRQLSELRSLILFLYTKSSVIFNTSTGLHHAYYFDAILGKDQYSEFLQQGLLRDVEIEQVLMLKDALHQLDSPRIQLWSVIQGESPTSHPSIHLPLWLSTPGPITGIALFNSAT
jgi:hypothetical protein